MSSFYFDSMRERVRREFPSLDEKQQRHICNVISNALRKFEADINWVEISALPLMDEGGYVECMQLSACGRNVYLRITVD